MTRPPTVKEELNRKVWETFAKLLRQVDAGTITEREFRLCAQALWDATSGLQEPDLFHFFSELKDPS